MGGYFFTTLGVYFMDGTAEVNPVNQFIFDLGVETLRLFAKVLHHGRALDAVRVAGEVFYVRRDHQLATGLFPGVKHGFEVGAGGVDGGGVAGGAGAYDDGVQGFGSHGVVFFWGGKGNSPGVDWINSLGFLVVERFALL